MLCEVIDIHLLRSKAIRDKVTSVISSLALDLYQKWLREAVLWVAHCKTMVSPLLLHLRYHSFTPSHQYRQLDHFFIGIVFVQG